MIYILHICFLIFGFLGNVAVLYLHILTFFLLFLSFFLSLSLILFFFLLENLSFRVVVWTQGWALTMTLYHWASTLDPRKFFFFFSFSRSWRQIMSGKHFIPEILKSNPSFSVWYVLPWFGFEVFPKSPYNKCLTLACGALGWLSDPCHPPSLRQGLSLAWGSLIRLDLLAPAILCLSLSSAGNTSTQHQACLCSGNWIQVAWPAEPFC